jgi:oligopeptide transport system substrate-binding protein
MNNSPGHIKIATAVQAMWKELGLDVTLRVMEWAQFLQFLGPPPNADVDVYRLGWIYDFPDAINGLELWTCDSGNNNTNYCDQAFDDVIAEAKATEDEAARNDLYAQAEDMLFGQDGAMPIIPIYWYTYTNLENLSIRETFEISPLDQIDLTMVVVWG